MTDKSNKSDEFSPIAVDRSAFEPPAVEETQTTLTPKESTSTKAHSHHSPSATESELDPDFKPLSFRAPESAFHTKKLINASLILGALGLLAAIGYHKRIIFKPYLQESKVHFHQAMRYVMGKITGIEPKPLSPLPRSSVEGLASEAIGDAQGQGSTSSASGPCKEILSNSPKGAIARKLHANCYLLLHRPLEALKSLDPQIKKMAMDARPIDKEKTEEILLFLSAHWQLWRFTEVDKILQKVCTDPALTAGCLGKLHWQSLSSPYAQYDYDLYNRLKPAMTPYQKTFLSLYFELSAVRPVLRRNAPRLGDLGTKKIQKDHEKLGPLVPALAAEAEAIGLFHRGQNLGPLIKSVSERFKGEEFAFLKAKLSFLDQVTKSTGKKLVLRTISSTSVLSEVGEDPRLFPLLAEASLRYGLAQVFEEYLSVLEPRLKKEFRPAPQDLRSIELWRIRTALAQKQWHKALKGADFYRARFGSAGGQIDHLKGIALYNLGGAKNALAAAQSFQAVLGLRPHWESFVGLALALAKAEKKDAYLKMISSMKGRFQEPAAQPWLELLGIQGLLLEGKAREALSRLERFNKSFPKLKLGWEYRIETLKALGAHAQAQSLTQKLLQKNQDELQWASTKSAQDPLAPVALLRP